MTKMLYDCSVRQLHHLTEAVELGVKMIGIGSEDIREGRKQGVLAIVWQLMRVHYLQIIGSKTEAQILEWVNTTSGKEAKSFGDEAFADGTLLIDLARSIEPRAINEELVLNDRTKWMYHLVGYRQDSQLKFKVGDDDGPNNVVYQIVAVLSKVTNLADADDADSYDENQDGESEQDFIKKN